MAKLTRHVTGKVANKIVVTAAEVRALLMEKFPGIPKNSDMECETDLSDRQGLENVSFEWTSDTSTPVEEQEIPTAVTGCRQQCEGRARRGSTGGELYPLPEIATESKLGQAADQEHRE
jgi:hypothetical protein